MPDSDHPRFVGLIPARGGSKRLPRKNLLPIAGKPLLAWTIEAGLAATHIDRLILSTDDDEIASVGRAHGADVPFKRPAELADDDATGLDVVCHALRSLDAAGERYDYVVVLQPTSPLRTAHDIDAAIALLLDRHAHSVTSVCRTDHPPEWSNTLPADGSMRDFFRPGVRGGRSQDLPTSYRLNGAIYIHDCAALLGNDGAKDDAGYAYVMPRERSIDIDEAIDLDIAELFLRRRTEPAR
ncbi:MAG: acylneuraminate cytidylyltransferase family protein [Gammaproteobacteria bacterium]|nr:acylneuraminate cytidylyltransferase family protein [Gammaproteobacteria bacterium]